MIPKSLLPVLYAGLPPPLSTEPLNCIHFPLAFCNNSHCIVYKIKSLLNSEYCHGGFATRTIRI